MRVSRVASTDRPGPSRRSSATASQAGFATLVNGPEAGTVSEPEAPADAAAATGLFAVQEVDQVEDATRAPGRRRAIARGQALLDRLEALQLDLLTGRIAPDRLDAIAALARDRRDAGCPPDVAALLDAIELRAEVELAKWNRPAGR